ncbi:MAG TPA: PilZ domain-containing protein [Terriglobia bacterium]|nr:PilZ domain-containing protein [Terriglobia bacterium]
MRIPIELPVSLRWESPAGLRHRAKARTGNISGNGLFILTSVRLRRDTEVRFTVLLPSEITKVGAELDCQGRVVRQRSQNEASGIAVVIDDYQLRSTGKPV